MSDRALRDEIEQLEMQVKSLRAELASFDVARRVEKERFALTVEISELEAREVAAARAPDIFGAELKQLAGELSLARASLSDARISIAKRQQVKTTPVMQQVGGCLPVVLVFVGASVWWLW